MRRLLTLWRDLPRAFNAEFDVTLNYQLRDVLLRAAAIVVIVMDLVILAGTVKS